MAVFFRKQIALPQDHGSWVFLLSPLLIGLNAGASFSTASILLICACLAAFLLRQPVSMLVKVYAGRRPKADLPAAWFWTFLYSLIALAAAIGLLANRVGFILYLAAPAAPIFAWHLWLISRRSERRQAGVEIAATGVLSLAAPAALWAGAGGYDPAGWWLWLLVWLQSAASIVYAYLRLEQRNQPGTAARRELWSMGRRSTAYSSFNLLFTLVTGLAGWLPVWIFVPFAVQWLEIVWGVTHPAAGWKPTQIGIRQLTVSSLWTVLFVLCWRSA